MPLRSQPLVSVITPVFNGEKYLTECIESVLNQTYVNWEYVIVNNRSTDQTLEIAQQYAASDARIRIHNNNEFLSVMQNFNHAVRQMSPASKYCKILCADDMLFPECLMQMVTVADANPTVGMVGAYMLQGDNVTCDGLSYPSAFISGREMCRLDLYTEGRSVFGSPTSTLIRADFIRNCENFYNEAHLYADREICYQILQHADFGFAHQVLTFMREHDEQQSSFVRRVSGFMTGKLYILKNYGRFYLTEDEYSELLKFKLKAYYRFLGLNLLNHRDKEFWEYHKTELKKIGYPFSISKMLKAAFPKLIDVLLAPKQAFEVLSRRAARYSKSKESSAAGR